MSITHITDRERELLARIELLRAALLAIQARVGNGHPFGIAYDVDALAGDALRADK